MMSKPARLPTRSFVLSLAVAGTALADATSNDTINTTSLHAGQGYGYSLDGTGVTVGIFEAGSNYLVRDTHQEFLNADGTSRVRLGVTAATAAAIGNGDHATAVASVIGGNGAGGAKYVGMAPNVNMVSYGSSFYVSKVNSDTSLDITNGSYGEGVASDWSTRDWTVNGVTTSYRTWEYGTSTYYRDVYSEDPDYGQYRGVSVADDKVLHDHPNVLAFFSAGNSRGNQYIDEQGDGKYVARFSPGTTPTNGTSLGNNYWLVSKTDYATPGSSGYDTLDGIGTMKNAVIVGATVAYTTDPHPKHITGTIQTYFSNYGPTDDGRLGVMLMADGNGLATATNSTDSAYTTFSGTSFSSPSAAGAAALLLQHWRNHGYAPTSATQKALLIHTATDIAGGGQIGPDYRTGYGLINGYAAAQFVDDASQTDVSKQTDHVYQTSVRTGQELKYGFNAVAGDDVEATLVWTDPEGVAHNALDDRDFRALVNDLNVWITDAAGTVYFPWTLDPDNPNAAAVQTQLNHVDNTEQVMIEGGLAAGALFTVHIDVTGTLTDGHGNTISAQDFSLLVSGGTLVPEPTAMALLGVAAAFGLRRRRA